MLNVKGCPPWLAILAFIEEHRVYARTYVCGTGGRRNIITHGIESNQLRVYVYTPVCEQYQTPSANAPHHANAIP